MTEETTTRRRRTTRKKEPVIGQEVEPADVPVEAPQREVAEKPEYGVNPWVHLHYREGEATSAMQVGGNTVVLRVHSSSGEALCVIQGAQIREGEIVPA